MTRLPFLVAALALAGPTLAAPRLAKDYSDRLAALPPIQRYAALRRAVLDSGGTCTRVLAARYQEPWKNLERWSVRCGPKPQVDYGAFVGPDGTVQVSTCEELVKVKLGPCRGL